VSWIRIFIIALSCLLWACNKTGKTLPVSTPYFDSVLAKAERIHDSGYKTRAINYVTNVHAHATNLSVADEMNYYTYCGEIFKKDFKEYDRYILCADSIVMILEKTHQLTNLHYRYVQAYNMRADGLFDKGLYNDAYDNYYIAKKLAKEDGDQCSLSAYSYSLGMVLYKQQRYLEAAGHFIASYNEAAACTDNFLYFYHKQEVLDNTGLCYNKALKYDSAMLYYKKAIAYIDSNYMRFENKSENPYISAKAVVFGNMADVYLALNSYDTARALLEKSISINLQKGYTNDDAILDQVKLANLYFSTNKTADAKNVLDKINAETDSIPNEQVTLSWNKLMWHYYDLEKDPVKAYKYLQAYVSMNDTLQNRNKSMMFTDVDSRIRSMEKQYQINQLNENNSHEKIYLAIACLIAVMAIIIVFLVMKNVGRSRDNVKKLRALNNSVYEQKEKLQIALAELEAKDNDKSRILRSVAHDVMNPIAAIMALTDILIGESADYTPSQKEMFGFIKEACSNSLSLSKDILEAAATTETQPIAKEWVDINKLATGSVELFNVRAAQKKQRIIVISGDEDIEAYVNREKIWRVINNLLGNAIKFSYENADIELCLQSDAENVTISVKDSGIGIAEKNKPFVFDMFTEAKLPGTSGEAPHGLGLSISTQIARAHGGAIWFESEEGKGTTFYFTFPIHAN